MVRAILLVFILLTLCNILDEVRNISNKMKQIPVRASIFAQR